MFVIAFVLLQSNLASLC